MAKATIRYHEAFLADIQDRDWISDAVLLKWFREDHSVSKHMLTLYSIVRGLKAKRMLEIGFGRSSLVLARAAHENDAALVCCDQGDCSYLFSASEKQNTRFVSGRSETIWKNKQLCQDGFDFAFLDYFGHEQISLYFVIKEVRNCISVLRTDGVLCIHDVANPKYPVHRIREYLRKDDTVEWITLPYGEGLAVIRKRKLHHGWLAAMRLKLFWWITGGEVLLGRWHWHKD